VALRGVISKHRFRYWSALTRGLRVFFLAVNTQLRITRGARDFLNRVAHICQKDPGPPWTSRRGSRGGEDEFWVAALTRRLRVSFFAASVTRGERDFLEGNQGNRLVFSGLGTGARKTRAPLGQDAWRSPRYRLGPRRGAGSTQLSPQGTTGPSGGAARGRWNNGREPAIPRCTGCASTSCGGRFFDSVAPAAVSSPPAGVGRVPRRPPARGLVQWPGTDTGGREGWGGGGG